MSLKNKRVLVTGADGFIGSHLVEALVAEGANVRALCQYNSLNHYGNLEGSSALQHISVVTGDVRDPHFCRGLVSGVDLVFHLAALIAIPYSYVAPDSYIDTNIKGTLNICQAAKELGNVRVIQTSTSEVYGTAEYVPIDELHPLKPQSPYSASKIGADAIAMSFYHAFSLPVTIARPFNTYGPRQSARAFIPTIISQIASGMTTIRVGDLSPTRDLNYVEDTCQGFVALANCEQAIGQTVNMGSNFEISMGDVLSLVQSIMQSNVLIEVDEQRIRPKDSEVQRLWCDNTKMKQLTGFVPTYGIKVGLEKTIEWFTNPKNLSNYKPNQYNK